MTQYMATAGLALRGGNALNPNRALWYPQLVVGALTLGLIVAVVAVAVGLAIGDQPARDSHGRAVQGQLSGQRVAAQGQAHTLAGVAAPIVMLGAGEPNLAPQGKALEKKNDKKPKTMPPSDARRRAVVAPEEARRRLADQLSLTDAQWLDWSQANWQLDEERSALMAGLEGVIEELRAVVLDGTAQPAARRGALESLDDLHGALRRVEAQRKSRLEALLTEPQRQRLRELMEPGAGVGLARGDSAASAIRSLRRLGLSAEQWDRVRALRGRLDERLHELEGLRRQAVEAFSEAVAAELTEPQRTAWNAARSSEAPQP